MRRRVPPDPKCQHCHGTGTYISGQYNPATPLTVVDTSNSGGEPTTILPPESAPAAVATIATIPVTGRQLAIQLSVGAITLCLGLLLAGYTHLIRKDGRS